MPKPPQDAFLTEKAREMRKAPTVSERDVWRGLRGGRLGGLRWRRQHPHRGFVLDFYCHALRLAIELDGDGPPESLAREAERREAIEAGGIRVLAFGSMILAGDALWEVLIEALESRAAELGAPLPGTLPSGGGQGGGV